MRRAILARLVRARAATALANRHIPLRNLLWAGLVAFFSASGSKLIPYILPMLPPRCCSVVTWRQADPAPKPKGLRSGFWLFLVATAALGAYLTVELARRPEAQADVLRLAAART